MPCAEMLLQATKMTLTYGSWPVLSDMSFAIHRGDFWFCLGRNGQGKSTLVQAMLGVHRSRTGQLWWHPSLGGHAQLGFVPQRCNLNPALPTTVREFVLLGIVGTSLRRNERRRRLEWALAKVGLEGMASRSYWELSGGEQQRALAARALVRRPQLLILDEPTQSFDLPTREAFLSCLAELNHTEQVAIFFVAHDLAMAARYATHLMLLYDGNMVAGTYREVFTPAILQQVYQVDMALIHEAADKVLKPPAPPSSLRGQSPSVRDHHA